MKSKGNKKRDILVRAILLCFFVYMMVSLVSLWKTLDSSREKLAVLKNEEISKKNDIEVCKAMLAEGSESRIIEKAARERLGYVYPDEQVFIDISGS